MWNFDEDKIDPYCNWTWFGGDLACFLSTAYRAWECHRTIKRLETQIKDCVSENYYVQSNNLTEPVGLGTLPFFSRFFNITFLPLLWMLFAILITAGFILIHIFFSFFNHHSS